VKSTTGRAIGGLVAIGLIFFGAWLLLTDACAHQFLARLCIDPRALQDTLQRSGILAPVIFMVVQAVAPIPGEVVGVLAGYLFGQWRGLLYATAGGALGSMAVFSVARWLGSRYARKLVSDEVWRKMGFIVEAEGAILCFVIFLIPGLPKDVASGLFGLSPMPFWEFAIASTLGRLPSVWVLTAQGAHASAGNYVHLSLLAAVAAAAMLPLVYYRNSIIRWLAARSARATDRRR